MSEQSAAIETTFDNLAAEMEACGAPGWAHRVRELRDWNPSRNCQLSDQSEFMRLGIQTIDQPNLDQAGRYLDHIAEELDEIDAAVDRLDAVDLVDGLVDLMVVTGGALISLLGTEHAKQAWDAVSGANLAKVDGTFGPIRWRDDGQIGKPEGWNGPEGELEHIVEASGLREAMKDAVVGEA